MFYYPAFLVFSAISPLFRYNDIRAHGGPKSFILLSPEYLNYRQSSRLPSHGLDRNLNVDRKRSNYDSIVFPSWNFNAAQYSDAGNRNLCFTRDGRVGHCVNIQGCALFHHTTPYFSLHLTQCGYSNAMQQLICCPGSASRSDILQKNKVTSITKSSSSRNPPEINQIFVEAKGSQKYDKVHKVNAAENQGNGTSPTGQVHHNTILNKKPNDNVAFTVTLEPDNMKDFNFTSAEASQVCGLQSSKDNWPWMVSIGYLDRVTSTIEWACLGSLITKEYILTTAYCLQRSPDYICTGRVVFGNFTHITKLANSTQIHVIAQFFQHSGYKKSALYNNVGLIRIKNPITVNPRTVPVCFPFVAGVLDIIQFAGISAKVVGYQINDKIVQSINENNHRHSNKNFVYEQYRMLNNTICSKLFEGQSNNVGGFPHGIRSNIMCGLTRKVSPPCLVSGAPVVIFDDASNSFVVIGISNGDSSCKEFRRQIVTFARINSFSSWVRERVHSLPSPPTCYF